MNWFLSLFATLLCLPEALRANIKHIRSTIVERRGRRKRGKRGKRSWLADPVLAFASIMLALILVPSVALAGPIEDLINAVSPGLTGVAWWGELVAAVVAGASLFAAATPKGEPGGMWDMLRRVVNWCAANVGNARPEGE